MQEVKEANRQEALDIVRTYANIHQVQTDPEIQALYGKLALSHSPDSVHDALRHIWSFFYRMQRDTEMTWQEFIEVRDAINEANRIALELPDED